MLFALNYPFMRLFQPLLTPVSTAPSLPTSQFTVCTSRSTALEGNGLFKRSSENALSRSLGPLGSSPGFVPVHPVESCRCDCLENLAFLQALQGGKFGGKFLGLQKWGPKLYLLGQFWSTSESEEVFKGG